MIDEEIYFHLTVEALMLEILGTKLYLAREYKKIILATNYLIL